MPLRHLRLGNDRQQRVVAPLLVLQPHLAPVLLAALQLTGQSVQTYADARLGELGVMYSFTQISAADLGR